MKVGCGEGTFNPEERVCDREALRVEGKGETADKRGF